MIQHFIQGTRRQQDDLKSVGKFLLLRNKSGLHICTVSLNNTNCRNMSQSHLRSQKPAASIYNQRTVTVGLFETFVLT